MKKERVLYLELLRIVSSVAVILIHVIAAVVNKYEVKSFAWDILIVCSSSIRWCIPIFFMISGSVFLNRDYEQSGIIHFLKKYVVRLLFVLVCFGTAYYFFDLWAWGISVGVKQILILPFAILSGNTGYHLWYLYSLITLYCLTPLLGIAVSKLDRKYLRYFVMLCMIFCFIAGYANTLVVQMYPTLESYQIGFSFCEQMGYVGCYLIGYYLSKYDLSGGKKRTLYILAATFIIILAVVNLLLSSSTGQFTVAFSQYTGLLTVLVACSLFLIFKQIDDNRFSLKTKKILFHIANHTFGIYLFHVFFVTIIFKMVIPMRFENEGIGMVMVGIIAVCVCSYMSSMIFKKLFPNIF